LKAFLADVTFPQFNDDFQFGLFPLEFFGVKVMRSVLFNHLLFEVLFLLVLLLIGFLLRLDLLLLLGVQFLPQTVDLSV
jgi:uncharacterized membrane protein YoaT (DUF817 family)